MRWHMKSEITDFDLKWTAKIESKSKKVFAHFSMWSAYTKNVNYKIKIFTSLTHRTCFAMTRVMSFAISLSLLWFQLCAPFQLYFLIILYFTLIWFSGFYLQILHVAKTFLNNLHFSIFIFRKFSKIIWLRIEKFGSF